MARIHEAAILENAWEAHPNAEDTREERKQNWSKVWLTMEAQMKGRSNHGLAEGFVGVPVYGGCSKDGSPTEHWVDAMDEAKVFLERNQRVFLCFCNGHSNPNPGGWCTPMHMTNSRPAYFDSNLLFYQNKCRGGLRPEPVDWERKYSGTASGPKFKDCQET